MKNFPNKWNDWAMTIVTTGTIVVQSGTRGIYSRLKAASRGSERSWTKLCAGLVRVVLVSRRQAERGSGAIALLNSVHGAH